MKQYILSYFEIGDKGERVHHQEVFLIRFVAKINLWFSLHNRNRVCHRLTEKSV